MSIFLKNVGVKGSSIASFYSPSSGIGFNTIEKVLAPHTELYMNCGGDTEGIKKAHMFLYVP